MDPLKKFGLAQKQAGEHPDMEKINAQALVELSEESVFTFRISACNDQVDRDFERFTAETLHDLADLYIGRPVIMDHQWSAKGQTGRVYDAEVEETDGVARLILRAYMIRNEATAPVIAAVEGGILREVSVSCSVARAICSICGTDKAKTFCGHRPGDDYDGETCVVDLDGAMDAYELSFCAVPAQPGAGVVKSYGGEKHKSDPELTAALARLELEKIRF